MEEVEVNIKKRIRDLEHDVEWNAHVLNGATKHLEDQKNINYEQDVTLLIAAEVVKNLQDDLNSLVKHVHALENRVKELEPKQTFQKNAPLKS